MSRRGNGPWPVNNTEGAVKAWFVKRIESALEELKKAYETKDLSVIDPALEKINEAWKSASEEMYKAQQESQTSTEANQTGEDSQADGDNVEDVDFEEVK